MFRKAPRLLRCPARFHRPLKTPRSNVNLVPGRTNIRSRSPRCTASSRQNNVGKGSRQIGSVTSGKGLALRTGSVGLECEAGFGTAAGWARPPLGVAEFGSPVQPSRGPLQLGGGLRVVHVGWHLTVNSELVRTRGIRLSN